MFKDIQKIDFVNSKQISKDKDIKTKKNKFSEFAGMWENYDVSIKSIRAKAWKRTTTS